MGWFRRTVPFTEMTTPPSRADLIRRGRMALLDDETPEVLADLQAQGFAVSHLHSTSDPQFPRLEAGMFDLLLLDYGGIGHRYGTDEGLDVLRHLRRVSPALIIVAFTGRTFDASKSDFFRMCHTVLKKDAGIRETLECVEHHLGIALTPAHQWISLCAALQLAPASPAAKELEKKLRKAAGSGRVDEEVAAALKKYGPVVGGVLIEQIAKRVLEYGTPLILGP